MREEIAHVTFAEPPELLFKAVHVSFIDHAYKHGLNRLKMPFIDAYESETEARRAFTKNRAYIFSIRSGEMYKDGYKFYKLDTGVWGTDEIPAKYLLLHG